MTRLELPNAQKMLPQIEENYSKYFNTAKTVWKLSLLFINEGTKIGIGKSHHLNWCLAGVYAKMIRLYLSIYCLLKEGLTQEASILLRSMFEIYVRLAALKKCNNQTEFARLWLLWDFVRDDVCYQELLKHKPEMKIIPDNLARILETEKSKLGKNWKSFKKYGPFMVPFVQLCKDINLESSYATLFRIASKAVHGSDLCFYAKSNQNRNDIICQLTPDTAHIESLIPLMILFLRDGMVMLSDLLALGKEKELKELNNIVNGFIAYTKQRVT